MSTEIAFVDLSSISYPLWMMSGSQPDPDYCSQQIVARIRALTADHPKAAICYDDARGSWRKELSPTYKANRVKPDDAAAMYHQIELAKERLAADGYPIWGVQGYEADDIIAAGVTAAIKAGDPSTSVLVISADKDLLQLVNERVRVLSPATGILYDAPAVEAKFGVRPEQIRDYLTLVGDASDNVKGAAGIGTKKAADLLKAYGTLEAVYDALDRTPTAFKPAMATSLREFLPRLIETQTLITLRADAALPFAELNTDRTPADAAPVEDIMPEPEIVTPEPAPTPAPVVAPPSPATSPTPAPEQAKPTNGNGNGAPLVEVVDALPVPYERQLEPRSLPQAVTLAKYMYAARMFNGYGTEQAVLSTILAGRELGLQVVASLRAFHVIDGKHALAADAMRALVLKSGHAEYFRCVERTPELAKFATRRKGDPSETALAYTIAEARAAFGFGDELSDKARAELETKWSRSGWGKHTPDMLAARASSKLARLVYADLLFGLYSPSELTDSVAA